MKPRSHDPGEPLPEDNDQMSETFDQEQQEEEVIAPIGAITPNMRFRAGHRGNRDRVARNIARRFGKGQPEEPESGA